MERGFKFRPIHMDLWTFMLSNDQVIHDKILMLWGDLQYLIPIFIANGKRDLNQHFV